MNYDKISKFIESGKFKEAFQECRALLATDPANETMFRIAMKTGMEAGLEEEVHKMVYEFADKNPESFEGLYAKGSFEILKTNFDSAVEIFSKLNKLDPTDLSVAVYLVTARFAKDPKDESVIEFLRPYISENPDSPLLLYYLALFLLEFKQEEELALVMEKLKGLDEKLYEVINKEISKKS
jgi:tetratricopeptide (TPR) repeat protein